MGGKNVFTNLSESLMTNSGQAIYRVPTNPSGRIIYPAIVRDVSDYAGYNRIKAEIVNFDSNGNITTGLDKNFTLQSLPFCVPLLPEFLHVRPKVGETVMVILENPAEPNSARYFIGPLITQQTKLEGQSFQASQSIFNKSSFSSSPTNGNQIGGSPSTSFDNDARTLFAKQDEIAIQGRNNSDIILSNNEVKIRTGIFTNLLEFKENLDFPCQIELKIVDRPISSTGVRLADSQINSTFEIFSQQNIKASNINLISPEGKFRKITASKDELKYNPRLNDFGDEAKTLHPAVLGDELVDVLINIINYLFSHAHPPQSPPLANNYAFNLLKFRDKSYLSAKILSNHIRLN